MPSTNYFWHVRKNSTIDKLLSIHSCEANSNLHKFFVFFVIPIVTIAIGIGPLCALCPIFSGHKGHKELHKVHEECNKVNLISLINITWRPGIFLTPVFFRHGPVAGRYKHHDCSQ